MRIYVAGVQHESSSFSPIPTSFRSFERVELVRRQAARRRRVRLRRGMPAGRGREYRGRRRAVLQRRAELARNGCGMARDQRAHPRRAPSGSCPSTSSSCVCTAHRWPTGVDDCEGDALAAAREIVGPGVARRCAARSSRQRHVDDVRNTPTSPCRAASTRTSTTRSAPGRCCPCCATSPEALSTARPEHVASLRPVSFQRPTNRCGRSSSAYQKCAGVSPAC